MPHRFEKLQVSPSLEKLNSQALSAMLNKIFRSVGQPFHWSKACLHAGRCLLKLALSPDSSAKSALSGPHPHPFTHTDTKHSRKNTEKTMNPLSKDDLVASWPRFANLPKLAVIYELNAYKSLVAAAEPLHQLVLLLLFSFFQQNNFLLLLYLRSLLIKSKYLQSKLNFPSTAASGYCINLCTG